MITSRPTAPAVSTFCISDMLIAKTAREARAILHLESYVKLQLVVFQRMAYLSCLMIIESPILTFILEVL